MTEQYKLDMSTPVRYVVTELGRAAQAALPISGLVRSYRHSQEGDLNRISFHEHTDNPKLWLITQAVKELGDQVEVDDGSVSLRKDMQIDDLRWEGRPVHILERGETVTVDESAWQPLLGKKSRGKNSSRATQVEALVKSYMKLHNGKIPSSRSIARDLGLSDDKSIRGIWSKLTDEGRIPPRPRAIQKQTAGTPEEIADRILPIFQAGGDDDAIAEELGLTGTGNIRPVGKAVGIAMIASTLTNPESADRTIRKYMMSREDQTKLVELLSKE